MNLLTWGLLFLFWFIVVPFVIYFLATYIAFRVLLRGR